MVAVSTIVLTDMMTELKSLGLRSAVKVVRIAAPPSATLPNTSPATRDDEMNVGFLCSKVDCPRVTSRGTTERSHRYVVLGLKRDTFPRQTR